MKARIEAHNEKDEGEDYCWSMIHIPGHKQIQMIETWAFDTPEEALAAARKACADLGLEVEE